MRLCKRVESSSTFWNESYFNDICWHWQDYFDCSQVRCLATCRWQCSAALPKRAIHSSRSRASNLLSGISRPYCDVHTFARGDHSSYSPADGHATTKGHFAAGPQQVGNEGFRCSSVRCQVHYQTKPSVDWWATRCCTSYFGCSLYNINLFAQWDLWLRKQ